MWVSRGRSFARRSALVIAVGLVPVVAVAAPASAAVVAPAVVEVVQLAGKADTGRLASRLAALADPAVHRAAAGERATLLSLPATGAGSLRVDASGRPLVEIATA